MERNVVVRRLSQSSLPEHAVYVVERFQSDSLHRLTARVIERLKPLIKMISRVLIDRFRTVEDVIDVDQSLLIEH